MKNKYVKITGGLLSLSLLGMVYSFAQQDNKENPKTKNYEVIRVIEGEVFVCDTIINNSDEFSPDDYLKKLGFDQDSKINIIDISDIETQTVSSFNKTDGTTENKMVVIEMDKKELTSSNGEETIIVQKKVIQTGNSDKKEETLDIDVNALLKEINIDSIINSMDEENGESDVVISKVMISDLGKDIDTKDIEWDTFDIKDADVLSENESNNRKTQVAVWGDNTDYTLVIVTNPGNLSKTTKASTPSVLFKTEVYPNPVEKAAQIKLDFQTKAPTVLTIMNINGSIIEKFDLGNINGIHTQDINLSNYQSGVYLIKVQHGEENSVERLIVS